MIRSQSLERIYWHAGLGPGEPMKGLSIARCTWPDLYRPEDLALALKDLMQSLSSLNAELNRENAGRAPLKKAEEDFLPRRLVFAVAEILRMLRILEAKKEQLEIDMTFPGGYWMVETAWLAILSGDIQDLEEHLRTQALSEF